MFTTISKDVALNLILSPDLKQACASKGITLERLDRNGTLVAKIALQVISKAQVQLDSATIHTVQKNLSMIESKSMSSGDNYRFEFFSPIIAQASDTIDALENASIIESIQRGLENLPEECNYSQLSHLMALIDKGEKQGELSSEQAAVWRQALAFVHPDSKPEKFKVEDELFEKIAKKEDQKRPKPSATASGETKKSPPPSLVHRSLKTPPPTPAMPPLKENVDVHQYNENKKSVHNAQKKELLGLMKSEEPFKELTEKLESHFKHLPEETLIARFNQSMYSSAIGSKTLATNFATAVLALNEYAVQGNRSAALCLQKLYDAYDHETDGKFSQIIATFPNLGMRTDELGTLCAQKLLSLPRIFDPDLLASMPPEKFKKYSENIVGDINLTPEKVFSFIYTKDFKAIHIWLCENAHALVKSYSQGNDPNTPGMGGCMSNATERYRLLYDNPKMRSEEIPMGPINRAKFAHSQATVGNKLSPKSQIVPRYLSTENPKRIGFKGSKHIFFNRLNPPLNTIKEALDTLSSWSQENPLEKSQCLFSFQVTSSHGLSRNHAINIQIDHQNQKFRVMDDNIGILEYGSYEELKQGVSSLLETFYPTHTNPSAFFFSNEIPTD